MIRYFDEEYDYLQFIKEKRITIDLYLVSGIKLVGGISGFDGKVIWLNGPGIKGRPQMVYKSAISTIVPHVNLEEKEA